MKTVEYKASEGNLEAVIEYRGLIAAAYGIKLSFADSNAPVFYHTGDNLNSEDDVYPLPSPPEANDRRILRLSSEFYGLDPVLSDHYTIELKIRQGGPHGVLIGGDVDEGKITGKTQSSLIFLKLVLVAEV